MAKWMDKARAVANHALYDEEPTPDVPYVPAAPVPPPAAIAPLAPSGVMSDAESDCYTRLAAATDYMKDKNVQQLFSLMKPLETIITDPHVRMKAALAQMVNTYGIGIEAIMAGLDQAIKALNSEAYAFTAGLNTASANIDEKKRQASKLKTDLDALRSEIDRSESKIRDKSSAFNAAMQRRAKELADVKADFTNLK